MRVLVVKTSSMGDVVHALPLLHDLAAARPDVRIDWVVEESFAAIPRLHPRVADVIPIALRRWRRSLTKGATWRELAAARRRLRAPRYDLVLDCQGLLKSAWVARWTARPVAGFDRGSAREPLASHLYTQAYAVPRTLHAIARNRVLAGAAFGYDVAGPPRFGLAPPPLDAALQPLAAQPYAVVLSNASRPTKLLPDGHWQVVAARLAARGLRSVLPWGSAAEGEATQRRAAVMAEAVVAPRAGLAALAPLLAGARIVVGLDTGLTHLAAALGAPTVGVYCDYDPRLVGVTGDARCVSVGDASGPPPIAALAAAIDEVLDDAAR